MIELPFHYDTELQWQGADELITQIEVLPTSAAASISLCPGISEALIRTRESSSYAHLQEQLDQLGSAQSDEWLPTETAFRDAWRHLCAEYTDNWLRVSSKPSVVDKRLAKWTVHLYVLARVCGFVLIPRIPSPAEVLVDHSVTTTIESWGGSLLSGVRALFKLPRLQETIRESARLRCSSVRLNSVPTIDSADRSK